MFVVFHTGYIEEVGYGTASVLVSVPQLSDELSDALLERGVSVIAADCSNV